MRPALVFGPSGQVSPNTVTNTWPGGHEAAMPTTPEPDDIVFRPAQRSDLPQIADLFFRAFPESVCHVVGTAKVPTRGIADAMAILLDAEPQALRVAAEGDRVAGYIFSPRKLTGVWKVALLRGHVCRLAWRWLTGRYGIGLRAVWKIITNKLTVVRSAKDATVECDARIFSVAVDPAYQGRGLGTRLTQEGLQYLQSVGAERVRLEVRPDNLAARHVYEKLGFQSHDRMTEDSQGKWLIMFKDLTPS
jgi:[ribosomal protein S18]-alanine N-acetyltransferase